MWNLIFEFFDLQVLERLAMPGDGSYLQLEPVDRNHTGQYVCQASNKEGIQYRHIMSAAENKNMQFLLI